MEEYNSLQKKEEFFSGKYTRIDNIAQLEKVIEKLNQLKQNEKDDKSHYSFRGINEARFKMYNSLQRMWHIRQLNDLDLDPIESVVAILHPFEQEDCVLRKYLNQMGVVCNDWWLLSFLQHYGAASPLLDFSRDYLTSLFFACYDVNYYESDKDVDRYFSLYYYSNKEVCNDNGRDDWFISKTILKYAEAAAAHKKPTNEDDKEIWKNELSFKSVIGKSLTKTVILPSYTQISEIKNKKNKRVTSYTLANLNITSQAGEFVCNVDMEKPIEEIFQRKKQKHKIEKYIHCIDIHKGLRDYIIKHYLGGSLDAAKLNYFPSERTLALNAQQQWLEKLNS